MDVRHEGAATWNTHSAPRSRTAGCGCGCRLQRVSVRFERVSTLSAPHHRQLGSGGASAGSPACLPACPPLPPRLHLLLERLQASRPRRARFAEHRRELRRAKQSRGMLGREWVGGLEESKSLSPVRAMPSRR